METTVEERQTALLLNRTKTFCTNASYADFLLFWLSRACQNARSGAGMTTVLVQSDPAATWLGGKLKINEIPNKIGLKRPQAENWWLHNLKVSKGSAG